MDTILRAGFWVAAALVVYSYLVYPFFMTVVRRPLRSRSARGVAGPPPSSLPTVEVVVAAYNEETHIRERILNLLSQEYDATRLSVAVGSDGSTDRTASEVRSIQDTRVRLLPFEQNRGKASVLNDLVRGSRAEIIVFTDANTTFEKGAVLRLIEQFQDESVGAVCGELLLERQKPGTNRDHEYWSVERRLKFVESTMGGLLGANGGIYAIRRELYSPLPEDTICDDFVIGMNVASSGARLVYDPLAIAREETPGDMAEEFQRRVRIGIGNYQAFFRHPEYLFDASPVRVFTYVSHKVLRWFTPHLLLVALVASAMLADDPLFGAIFALQCMGYLILSIGYASRGRIELPRLLSGIVFVGALNAAFFVGFVRYVSGNYRGSWRRSER